jgi:hypothetical protein
MMDFLSKSKPQNLFAVAGILLLLLSMFTVQDLAKFQFVFVHPIRREPFLIGSVLVLISLVGHVAPYLKEPFIWTATAKVKSVPNGLRTEIGRATIEVCLGRIQDLFQASPEALVALPANDLFDDACINDSRSSLGAFVAHVFPNQTHEICRLVREKTSESRPSSTENQPATQRKFEIGTTLHLSKPLNKDVHLAFIATTNVLPDQGIRCEATNVFRAIQGLHTLMNTARLDSVLLPVIGSGHGGLHPQTSLICMLIAIAESLKLPSGSHIRRVKVVVFQKEKGARPDIPYGHIRRALAFVQRYC